MSDDIVIDLLTTSPAVEINIEDVSLEVVVDITESGPIGPQGPQGPPGGGVEALTNLDIESIINSFV